MVDFRNLLAHEPLTSLQKLKMTPKFAKVLQYEPIDGVFQGGGALGAAYVGGLRALEDNHIWFARVAGNSAGAITASMIAAGFTASEIQWLTSAFLGDDVRAPQSLQTKGINRPIDFTSFLDLPTLNSITTRNKRKTLLWRALNGSILDRIGQELDKVAESIVHFPTQAQVVAASVEAIMQSPLGFVLGPIGGADGIRATLNIALDFLPNQEPHLSDFLPDTTVLRDRFADRMWDAVSEQFPLMLMLTNLAHEGSLFEGDNFLETMTELLDQKVDRQGRGSGPVLFRHLPIPLAVIVSDIDTGKMLVFDSKTTPDEPVAEAVRRSMSIPFIFEPRGPQQQLVDGGLFSNFPLWLFSSAGEEHWPVASRSNSRYTIGFTLGEDLGAERTMGVPPAKFQLNADGKVDTFEVLKPILMEKLVELGYSPNLVSRELVGAFGDGGEPELEILHQIDGVINRGVLNTEDSTREIFTSALMAGRNYLDVPIPLLGFHSLDFHVNTKAQHMRSMWDRAWKATVKPLAKAQALGNFPAAIKVTDSPFS